MRVIYLGTLVLLAIVCLLVQESDAWSGNIDRIRYRRVSRRYYCACWYWWWGCSFWRYYWRVYYTYTYRCKPGWTHNGNQNCNIPICRPHCANGGTCDRPNTCYCPTTSQGPGCRQLTCSYRRPCYPGECNDDQSCTCEKGFSYANVTDGCTIFQDIHLEAGNSTLAPTIDKSTMTLSNIQRDTNRTDYMFILDGTETDFTDIIWLTIMEYTGDSNQARFNNLRFETESLFTQPSDLPDSPAYVHDAKMGVVGSQITTNITKIPRSGGPIRDPGSFKTYVCDRCTTCNFSPTSPAVELAQCEINDDQFKTLIEHGDWLTVTFRSDSGGFQKLINLDQGGAPYATRLYTGLRDTKQVEFRFDFRAPKNCEETETYSPGTCPQDSHILRVDEEFTKNPIRATWRGWQDDLSGVWEYYVEIFKLSPDPYERLVEMSPLEPVFNATITHTDTIAYPEYKPDTPGMYSVLVETKDIANNSRVCRRLVLYDDESSVELNDALDGKLYIESAVEETGNSWQNSSSGQATKFVVNWGNHFINHVHVDGKLLNQVLGYPTQFGDIEEDGILFSKKYVPDSLDDFEGQRTREKIDNFNGIVKFEMAKEFTESDLVPTTGWELISPLAQTAMFDAQLTNGARVRVWIRATDVFGNVATDSTVVNVDSTPPLISSGPISGAEHKVTLNVEDGRYDHTSRISFVASDEQSGVHKLGYNIIIHTPGKPKRTVFQNSTGANIGASTNPLCRMIDDQCFIPQQHLELNNCWFLISKADLEHSTAIVEVAAYNQALLESTTRFEIGNVTQLKGLETYFSPTDLKVTSIKATGFSVSWTLPEKTSCYGIADIVILVTLQTPKGSTILRKTTVAGTETHFDILGLNPLTEYGLSLKLRMPGGEEVPTDNNLQVRTDEYQKGSESKSVGLIVGIVVGLLVLVILGTILVVILIRLGVIKPAKRAQQIKRAVLTKFRKTVNGGVVGDSGGGGEAKMKAKPKPYAYDVFSVTSDTKEDNRQRGGMDEGPQNWHLDRNDVTFETLIKSGHFANIYKAKLRTGSKPETVVAKTLKEGYTPDDEFLMKAKLNFSGTVVGDHPNCLKFVGAVVGDPAMGPFIVYEYCENGTLKEYVKQHKINVTIEVQDNFYRFGLDIAKGMEYLASKGVVHRHLAARNILLTFLNEVKIAGFGPQLLEDKEGADQCKKKRIPIKWMAPECMTSTKGATEKSDVWSYAVVLWEIFSLGELPFNNVRSRDLPTRIKKGERLPKPENCDDTWYEVMRKCWAYEKSKRPTFTDIRDELDTMFVSTSDDLYYYQR